MGSRNGNQVIEEEQAVVAIEEASNATPDKAEQAKIELARAAQTKAERAKIELARAAKAEAEQNKADRHYRYRNELPKQYPHLGALIAEGINMPLSERTPIEADGKKNVKPAEIAERARIEAGKMFHDICHSNITEYLDTRQGDYVTVDPHLTALPKPAKGTQILKDYIPEYRKPKEVPKELANGDEVRKKFKIPKKPKPVRQAAGPNVSQIISQEWLKRRDIVEKIIEEGLTAYRDKLPAQPAAAKDAGVAASFTLEDYIINAADQLSDAIKAHLKVQTPVAVRGRHGTDYQTVIPMGPVSLSR